MIAYIQSNWKRPNLIVNIGQALSVDVTATMAKIEMSFGSRTECSKEEALERRKQKERLKLLVLASILGADLSEEDQDTARHWIVPQAQIDNDVYEYFTPKETE